MAQKRVKGKENPRRDVDAILEWIDQTQTRENLPTKLQEALARKDSRAAD